MLGFCTLRKKENIKGIKKEGKRKKYNVVPFLKKGNMIKVLIC